MAEPKEVSVLNAFLHDGEIEVNILLCYLKNEPIARAELTVHEALRLAYRLVELVDRKLEAR